MAKKNKIDDKKDEDIQEEAKAVETPVDPVREEMIQTRNNMITSLRPLLLTKRDVWKGGSDVRGKHAVEASSFQPIVDEINKLGLEIGETSVSIDQLRREG